MALDSFLQRRSLLVREMLVCWCQWLTLCHVVFQIGVDTKEINVVEAMCLSRVEAMHLPRVEAICSPKVVAIRPPKAPIRHPFLLDLRLSYPRRTISEVAWSMGVLHES